MTYRMMQHLWLAQTNLVRCCLSVVCLTCGRLFGAREYQQQMQNSRDDVDIYVVFSYFSVKSNVHVQNVCFGRVVNVNLGKNSRRV